MERKGVRAALTVALTAALLVAQVPPALSSNVARDAPPAAAAALVTDQRQPTADTSVGAAVFGALASLARALSVAPTLAAAVLVTCTSTGTPSVTTDRTDYSAGDTVLISATGLTCGASYEIRVTRPDGSAVSSTVIADDAGRAATTYLFGTENGDFTVAVIGAGGAVVATTMFHGSHFRYGHLTWRPVGTRMAEFTLTNAFRRNGYCAIGISPCRFPIVGDAFLETIGGTSLLFGDATFTATLVYETLAFDATQDWVIGRAVVSATDRSNIRRTYATDGPFTASIDSCCRINGLANSNVFYRVQTVVRFDQANSSPVSSLPPIVNAPVSAPGFSFLLPAIDADGDALSFRLASDAESGISNPIGPLGGVDAPNALTVAATGLVSWNTTGTSTGQLYTTQIVIEERRAGVLIGRSAVDFILRIVASVGTAPSCVLSPAQTTYTVAPGQALSFTVSGTDPDAGDTLTINTGGLPPGATMTPPLPTSGASGVSSTFNWTPPLSAAGGAFAVSFTITDANFLAAQCAVTINVVATVSIAAEVREDTDRDGVLDAGEPLTNAAKLELFRLDGSGSRLLPAAATAENSPNIIVSGIEAGTFELVETDAAGFFSTGVTTSASALATRIDNNTIRITLAAGQQITGLVFLDARTGARGIAQYRETPDGVSTTTVTLGGAVVTLIDPAGAKRRLTAAADGTFSFAGLLANTTHVVGYDATVAGRHFITGVRFTTDALGNANIPAPQAVFNRKNHTWVSAYLLSDNTPVPDQVWRRGQATWYRYAISPQTNVTIELTGCPFNCDLVVYKDLKQLKAELEARAQTQAGVRLSLQGDIMADDLDADDLDADDLDADDLDADDLDADDLDADDLDADGDLLTGYGTTYVAVQRKGLRAASLTPGLAPETVVINTRSLTGELYIRVAGGSSLTGVFTIKARRTADVSCLTAPLVARQPSTTAAALPTGKRSLILTDTLAYGLAGTAKADFLAKLAAFAAHVTVDGFVLDLAGDAAIQQLRADWALNRTCVAQANLATDAIREIVQRFRSQNALEYLVNVGGDSVIPFRRVADWAEISRESKYSPPVDGTSASEASLVGNTFLSDDFYVASAIEGPNRTLYLPEVAVGRLVESVADVTAYVDMYIAANGVASPTAALSSGYDFNLDLANEVTARLAARGLAVDATLVSNTWSSADWRAKVLNTPAAAAFGILSLQGHFTANRLVPADNGQRVLSTEIAAVADGRFMRALVYSLGCHSGYSIVNADATIFTQPLAFPEAFVGRGATVVAGTGYQYGETELMKNTEALLALLTLELGYSSDVLGDSWASGVPIGKALRNAKRAYMAQTATPRGIDLKVVGVSTVYGSPTMKFKLPTTQARPSAGTLAPVPVTGFAGLSALDVAPSFTLTRTPLVGDPAYYSAGGATTTAPYRPIAPLVTVPANAAGSVLQGAVFLGGAYTEGPFVPRLSIPATELGGDAPRYANDVFMPVLPVRTNLFDGDAVQIVPFQYRSNAAGTAGTARVFDNVQVRAYWSSRTGTAAAADAPVIRDVSVKLSAGQLVVIATVRGLTDPGVAEVLLTSTNTAAVSRSFASLAMAEIPGTTVSDGLGLPGFTRLYTATVPGNAAAIRFLVQAVSGNGRVAAATSNGQLYGLPTAAPAIDTRPGSALTLSAPTSATYRSTITASATLTAGGLPLAGKGVRFELGGSSRLATTDGDGFASATLDVNVAPRATPYALRASFAGDASALGSGASANVTVGRAPTVLELLPASPQYSDGAAVARLLAHGLTLNEQPIVLERSGVQVATVTDFAGQVQFDTIDFGAGVGPSSITITYPGNARYAGGSATATVNVQPERGTVALTQLDPQPAGPITFLAQVAQEQDGSLGDLSRAVVQYVFRPEIGTPISATATAVAVDGSSTITVTLPAGVYRVEAQLGGFYTSEVTAMALPVFDPDASVTGGGFVFTQAGAIGVPAGKKSNFGFVAKYLPNSTTASGNLLLHVLATAGSGAGETEAQAAANGSVLFRSTAFDWLVISSGVAEFAGAGKVNGVLGYRFRVEVRDAAAGDTFDIRIWDPARPVDSGGSFEHPTYHVSNALAGGNIRIHL